MNRSIKALQALVVAAPLSLTSSNAFAAGAWLGGQDLLHVPMSWCVVQGSPAEANPNINGDTDTDALIWRRHERPTDNIFINQAGISLRSAINNAWGSFNFPVINDPDVSNLCGAFPCVTQSDIRGEDVNVFGAEFNAVINACETAYNNIGRAGIGITAVNLGVYHDAANNYVGVIGWGGCSELPAGTCIAPYDGRIAVIDNRYLFPSSPNRQLPGNNPSTGASFILTDPFDQLTGHEVGHALSLNHRNNSTALMNPSISDNNADGQADNIALNNTEVTALRANALNVPGLEIDPPGVFNPGAWLAQKVPSRLQPPGGNTPPFLDIAGVRAVFNKDDGEHGFEIALGGLTPKDQGQALQYWFLVDEDGERATGCQSEQLDQIGVPLPGALTGVGMVALVEIVAPDMLRHRGWGCDAEGGIRDITDFLRPLLATFAVYPHFAEIQDGKPGQRPEDQRYPVHDIVRLNVIPEAIPPIVNPGKPFRMEVLSAADGKILDVGGSGEGEGLPLLLEDPEFPHCFPQGPGVPGEEVQILVDNFGAANGGAPIHGLLGAMAVFNGVLDANGEAKIDFPVPPGTAPGFHLVTIGIDDTALTADCTLRVEREDDPDRCPADLDVDGDVDRVDASLFSRQFGRTNCRIQ